jgi:hypothetical protein
VPTLPATFFAMDRRKLIIGGGAAAVATTLSAVAGTRMPARAATLSTEEHARLVLDEVNVDLGLVNPEGIRRQLEQWYRALLASPPPEPSPDDLQTWIRRRMVELCGTDSYADAATKIPETRTLLAFNYLAYSQNQDEPLPEIDFGASVPPVFEKLEPDFLPVLLQLINEKSRSSREFATALEATLAELDRYVAEKLKEFPGGKDSKSTKVRTQAAPGEPGAGDALNFLAGMLVVGAFLYWMKRELKL